MPGTPSARRDRRPPHSGRPRPRQIRWVPAVPGATLTTFLFFVDGLGAGRRDPERNPCLRTPHRLFASFGEPGRDARDADVPLGGVYKGLDAAMGVDGVPQSATGQTTLFTGVNAAALLGFHLWAFPNQQLRQVLAEHSIHRQLTERGRVTRFLNAFRGPDGGIPDDVWTAPRWVRMISASVWANRAAGNPFFGVEALREGRAVSFDLTNRAFLERGLDVPVRTEEEAGETLARGGRGLDFCLFEFFETDRAGHKLDLAGCAAVLERLERCVLAFVGAIDPVKDTVLLTSDHGNIEDAPSHGHTSNPAQALAWGRGARALLADMASLTDVTPGIVQHVLAGAARGPVGVPRP